MKLMRWILSNAMFAACLYAGYFMEIAGAKNLSLFLAWVLISIYLISYTKDGKELHKNRKHPVPDWVETSTDVLIICFFAWFGHIVTAALLFIGFAGVVAARLGDE